MTVAPSIVRGGLRIRHHEEALDHSDFDNTNTSREINGSIVTTVPTWVIGGHIDVGTEFLGGAISEYRIEAGGADPIDSSDFLKRVDVFTATGRVWTPFLGTDNEQTPTFYPSGFQVRLRAVAVGANLDQATQGDGTLHIYYFTV